MLELYIGNKNYSSWSMRPWVFMRQTNIAFEEVMVRFDSFAPDSQFKQTIARLSPTGKVPVLVDGDITLWDSLAIAEYLAETQPTAGVWPQSLAARAYARNICAEMHSGFMALRSHCSMNIEADLSQVGARLWQEHASLRHDVARICTMWETLLARHGGPYLFGAFSMADAYFTPVVMRLTRYALPTTPTVQNYIDHICALPSVQAWIHDALAEKDFLPFQEQYRQNR